MILLIDNYDSFTFNIFQYLRKKDQPVRVCRNDEIGADEIRPERYSHVIISPGPGTPEKAGISVEAVKQCAGRIPLLGICLGHQAIGAALGARVIRSPEIWHGRVAEVTHNEKEIFRGIRNPMKAVRYHSLVLEKKSVSGDLEVTATSEDGCVMGVRHRYYSVWGIQFHPESIGTPQGEKILSNFVTEEHEEPVVKKTISRVLKGEHLEEKEAHRAMAEIAAGKWTDAQIAALLCGLSVKGETVAEIAGFVSLLKQRATGIRKPPGRTVVDTCGTGGDGRGTFNISTTAALVSAAAGCTVAKHGNRSVTSRCGSADLLESLGVCINAPAEVVEGSLERAGIGFLFAPALHPAMKTVAQVRRQMGVKTVFNLLGPLVNPAGADCQMIGVFHPGLTERLAGVLVKTGVERALVVHGMDGMDEITLTRETRVSEVNRGWVRTYNLQPADFDLPLCSPEDIRGGDLKTNTDITLAVLQGEAGARRDTVVLNAGASIYISGKAPDIAGGMEMARRAIDSGKAMEKLKELIRVSNGR